MPGTMLHSGDSHKLDPTFVLWHPQHSKKGSLCFKSNTESVVYTMLVVALRTAEALSETGKGGSGKTLLEMMSELSIKDEHQSDEAGRLLLPVWGSGPGHRRNSQLPWPLAPAVHILVFVASCNDLPLPVPGVTQTQVQILAPSFTVTLPGIQDSVSLFVKSQ